MTGAAGSGEGARFRRAVTLLVLTLVAPGSAQLIAGNRTVGRVAIRIAIGVVVLAAALGGLAMLSLKTVVGLLTNETILGGLRVVLIVLALGWLGLFVDAWRLGQPLGLRPRQRMFAAGMTGVLSVLTVGALVLSSQYVAVAHNSLAGVFGSTAVSDPTAGRYNVLLLGADAGDGRVGLRPDSLNLASVNAETGETVLLGFPRNLQKVPFPEGSVMRKEFPNGFDCGEECLLNAVYTWGADHEELFPKGADAGLEATKEAVEGITGLPVNYHALVDMGGFEALVDAVGGVNLDVRQRLPIGSPPYKEWVEAGRQQMDGRTALWYARSRKTTSDYDRMARQRCVMNAMLNQLDPATVLARFQEIARAGGELVETDIPASELNTFLDLALKAKRHEIASIQFVPPIITTANPDYGLIREKVRAAVGATADKKATPQGESSSPASPGSGGSDPGGSGEGTPTAGAGDGSDPVSGNDTSAIEQDDEAAAGTSGETPAPSGKLGSVCSAS